jgi:hypothetical protein
VSEEIALAFARDALGSVWSLEVLVVLQTNEKTHWLLDELERELRASHQVVLDAVQALERLELAAIDGVGRWHYAPQNQNLDEIAKDLLRIYAVKPLAVVEAIYASPAERIRAFAQAFKFKD